MTEAEGMVGVISQVYGLRSPDVLSVMLAIPRHEFVLEKYKDDAYLDKPVPIGHGQTMSQPYTVASMTHYLLSGKGQVTGGKNGESGRLEGSISDWRVLEIGTGSGYQAAILAEMGARVYTIERIKELFLRAQRTLSSLGYNIDFFYGDGYEGKAQYGPYDGIIITAATPHVPETAWLSRVSLKCSFLASS